MSEAMTLEQAVESADAEWHEFYFEIVNGQRRVLPLKGAYELVLASELGGHLDRGGGILGRTVVQMLFLLQAEPKLCRRPDVAFVSHERWPANRRLPRTDAWDVVPDLAAEIVSRTNLADDIPLRVQEYFDAGARRYWLIFPSASVVYQYDADSPKAIHVLTREDELDGGEVLPGFRLPLATLFGDEEDDSKSRE